MRGGRGEKSFWLGRHPGTAWMLAFAGLAMAGGALMVGVQDRHQPGADPLIAHRQGFDYEINPSAFAPADPPAAARPAAGR